MQLSGFFILLTYDFLQMFIPIWWGLGQTDSINQLIQLTVIQLSGGHCSASCFKNEAELFLIKIF
jgi:hypothetical protein